MVASKAQLCPAMSELCLVLDLPNELLRAVVLYLDVACWPALMRTCKALHAIVSAAAMAFQPNTVAQSIYYGLYGPLKHAFPCFTEYACSVDTYKALFKQTKLRSVAATTYVCDVSEEGCFTENTCIVAVHRKGTALMLDTNVSSKWVSRDGRKLTAVKQQRVTEASDIRDAALRFGRARLLDALTSVFYPGMPLVSVRGIVDVVQALHLGGVCLHDIIAILSRASMFSCAGNMHVRFDASMHLAVQDMYEAIGGVYHAHRTTNPLLDIALHLNTLDIVMYPLRVVQQHHLTRIIQRDDGLLWCVRSYVVTQAATDGAGSLFVWLSPEASAVPAYYTIVWTITRALSKPCTNGMFSTIFKKVGRHSVEYAVKVLLRNETWEFVPR